MVNLPICTAISNKKLNCSVRKSDGTGPILFTCSASASASATSLINLQSAQCLSNTHAYNMAFEQCRALLNNFVKTTKSAQRNSTEPIKKSDTYSCVTMFSTDISGDNPEEVLLAMNFCYDYDVDEYNPVCWCCPQGSDSSNCTQDSLPESGLPYCGYSGTTCQSADCDC
jgi:hypothetical protein